MNSQGQEMRAHWLMSLLIVLFFSGTALAAPIVDITYTETDLGGGNWQYEYTVTNMADPISESGFNVYDVFFTYDQTAAVTITGLPGDWDAIDGPGFVETFSVSPGVSPFGADISPGASLSGFVLQFDKQIGDLPFDALFENPEWPFDPVTYIGSTAQASVPEPTTSLLVATGLLGLCFARRKR